MRHSDVIKRPDRNTDQQDLPVDNLELLLRTRDVDPKRLHERASELTRQKILLSAMERFASKGYQNTNIREIARAAGVTQGAVYHHFKGKKQLLMAANRARQVYSIDVVRKSMEEEEDFFTALRKALQGLFRLLHATPFIRGVTREYMAMAMIDPDINRMYRENDLEFFDILEREIARRYANLPAERRAGVMQMLYVSLEGLFTALVVDSPIVGAPEDILEPLVNTFRHALEE